MVNHHDRYQQEIVAECRDCGAKISRYYYAGFPFCDECRAAYRKKKFEAERAGRGGKTGSIAHLPWLDVAPNVRGEQVVASACGGDRVTAYDVLPDGAWGDTSPTCWTCAKATAKWGGIDLREEDECSAICPEHKEPCSVVNPRDVAGLAGLFGGKDFTLREHRKKGPHLCFSGGAPPKPHTWGGA